MTSKFKPRLNAVSVGVGFGRGKPRENIKLVLFCFVFESAIKLVTCDKSGATNYVAPTGELLEEVCERNRGEGYKGDCYPDRPLALGLSPIQA